MADIIYNEKCEKIINEIKKVMIGKDKAIELLLVSFLSGGHILIDDVPGVGKTTVALALARATSLDCKRIQFNPDIMASDITGYTAYNKQTSSFEYKEGVVMTNILIADEINRTSPKTQSALLEVMEEGKVTVDGVTRNVKQPFIVVATQNPIGFIGTHPLPEAQLDRFILRMTIGYPSVDQELKIITDRQKSNPLDNVCAVASDIDIMNMRNEIMQITLDEKISKYIVDLVSKTREHEDILLAASPRASLSLMRAGCAYAYIHGRNYVVPDDINEILPYVLGHRIVLTPEAKISHKTTNDVLNEIKNLVSVPMTR